MFLYACACTYISLMWMAKNNKIFVNERKNKKKQKSFYFQLEWIKIDMIYLRHIALGHVFDEFDAGTCE